MHIISPRPLGTPRGRPAVASPVRAHAERFGHRANSLPGLSGAITKHGLADIEMHLKVGKPRTPVRCEDEHIAPSFLRETEPLQLPHARLECIGEVL